MREEVGTSPTSLSMTPGALFCSGNETNFADYSARAVERVIWSGRNSKLNEGANVYRNIGDILYSRRMALKRMDNVGIVVDDLGETIDFFRELGLELEGRATIEGEWAGRVTGLADQRVEIAMMRTPDGHSRLELSRFLTPPVVADHRNAPVNALGYLRVMFAVDDIDETLGRLRKRGAQLVGEVVRYQDSYRLCYIRGPEGLLIGLAQELN
jgi:catechol 2,3-dioxygenase-like lactoylglutathione lyase family enzyme